MYKRQGWDSRAPRDERVDLKKINAQEQIKGSNPFANFFKKDGDDAGKE